ncbi:MAG TPA: DMT family transporter [Candidatus Fimousia stercorigallinarum]|nr:DMT family transporter [Candidatus Fimousia stercorigallinarum]
MISILTALISGALMSVQGVFNTGVTKQTSMWVANSFVQVTGFFLCLVIWFAKERDQSFLSLMKVEPKYFLLGGILGAGITMTVIQSMNSLGPAKAVMLIVISQIVIAYLIELFGLFGVDKVPFQWSKLIGTAVTIIGIVIFKYKT